MEILSKKGSLKTINALYTFVFDFDFDGMNLKNYNHIKENG